MANSQAEMIEIGARVRYVGASEGTQQRSHGRVGTVRHLAIKEGMVGNKNLPTARVSWSESTDDWNHVLLSELALESAS